MVSSSAFAVATGAALLSLAVASPVCKVRVSVEYGKPTWKPDGGNPKPYPSATWGDWSNWENKPVPTTSLTETYLNPKPTSVWGNWVGHQSSTTTTTTTTQEPHLTTTTPGSKPWAPWTGWSTITTTPGSNGTATATSTSTSTSGDVTVTTTATSSDTTITTTATSTTTSDASTTTTTTSETSSTTTGACPAPTESFYLRALDTENPSVFANYASLARLDATTNNYLVFNQGEATDGTVFNFNADCQITSGPRVLLVLDEPGQFEPVHYQYVNIPGEETGTLDYVINTCAVNEANIVTCTVRNQSVFQVQEGTDRLIIGDQLYYPSVTIALIPVDNA